MKAHEDNARYIEKHFYPNAQIKSEWIYQDNKLDKLLEAKNYAEDGTLIADAKKYAHLNDCSLGLDKSKYKIGEPAEFSISCRCKETQGCFRPQEFNQRLDRWIGRIVIQDDRSRKYRLLYAPFNSFPMSSSDKYLFKDGENVLQIKFPGPYDLRLVPSDNSPSLINNVDQLFNKGMAEIPEGTFTAWLQTGSGSAKVNFTVEDKK